MDLIYLLCVRAYLDPAKYNDLQTPYVQVENFPKAGVTLAGVTLASVTRLL